MKKIILIISLLLISSIAFSQTMFGVRAGANISNLSNLDTKKSTNFYAGVLLSLKKSESYTLQPEMSYSIQGAKLDSNYILAIENSNLNEIKLEFLSLSLINKITTKNNIHFLIGPFIDIRMDDNVKNDGYLLEGLFPRLDAGVQIGLGYDITSILAIEVRYKQGFADMINEHDIYQNYPLDDTNLNQVFQFGITYKFDLKENNK